MIKTTDIVVDLQFGSTGKGLLAGYLAEKNDYDMVVNANMPNAGHTYIDARGRKYVHKVLPNAVVSPTVSHVGIGPGSVFDPDRLLQEMDECDDHLYSKYLVIHECAGVLQSHHKTYEQANQVGIASTMQGSMAALNQKMERRADYSNLAREVLLDTPLIDNVISHRDWLDLVNDSRSLLVEGAQGYSLGINAGFWPYCTSRDCTPARFLADTAVPLGRITRTYGTLRTYPIRVGNVYDEDANLKGWSGPCYADQEEISWEQLGLVPELTTVTNRPRRIFTFSHLQLAEALKACTPANLFLNFCNYIDDASALGRLIEQIHDTICRCKLQGLTHISHYGWGPSINDISETRPPSCE